MSTRGGSLKERMDLKGLRKVTGKWVKYHNGRKPHQSPGYKTPDDMNFDGGCGEVTA